MLDYGEISYSHTSPFQSDMLPGELVQVRNSTYDFVFKLNLLFFKLGFGKSYVSRTDISS